jgi:hypothetical protein
LANDFEQVKNLFPLFWHLDNLSIFSPTINEFQSNEARQQMLAMTASAARKDARLRAVQNHFNGYSTKKASVAVRNIGEKGKGTFLFQN